MRNVSRLAVPVTRLPFMLSAALLLSLTLLTLPANAMKIEKVVSPKGITAWLVEDHTLPMFAMQFGFGGGSAQDPKGKEGVAFFVSGMLDEGAGEIESREFQERLQELAIRLDFDATRDVFTGGLQTLSENRDEAFRLLKLSLTAPRMDVDAVERVRAQIQAIIKASAEDPQRVAGQAWFENVFGDHPYGSDEKGTLETLASITPEDLKRFTQDTFARSNLKIGVVGSITADELAASLDDIFGDLPEQPKLKAIEDAQWQVKGREIIIPMATPQTVVTFGFPGPKRDDPDYYAAYVLNYIIGGGGFSSRLMEEVREKRGLAYSTYTYMNPLDHAGLALGGVATKNERVGQSITLIKDIMTQISLEGPTEEELKNAKQYLTGSYALRFSSSARIASILLWVQIENLGIDYIDNRNSIIESVTMDDIKRVASGIDPRDMVFTIVGRPFGIDPAVADEALDTRG